MNESCSKFGTCEHNPTEETCNNTCEFYRLDFGKAQRYANVIIDEQINGVMKKKKRTKTNYEEYIEERKASSEDFKRMCDVRDEIVNIRMLIIARRVELGFTKNDLAKKCELSLSTIQKFEQLSGNPSMKTLFEILNALGMKLEVSDEK